MSARQWTREELDRVHPLPDGWLWAHDSVGWFARLGLNYTVCIDASGDVVALSNGTRHFEPPADVVLPVILASKGMDSLEAMADAMDAEADAAEERDRVERADGADWSFDFWKISACRDHSAMLRRGRVKP